MHALIGALIAEICLVEGKLGRDAGAPPAQGEEGTEILGDCLFFKYMPAKVLL